MMHWMLLGSDRIVVPVRCWPSRCLDSARRGAFESAGMNDPIKVTFSKVDEKTGTVVEFKGGGWGEDWIRWTTCQSWASP